MFITIPLSKHLIVLLNASNRMPVEAWAAGDSDAPEGESTEYSFVSYFIRRTLLIDPSWGQDMNGILTCQELRGYFAGKQPGDVVEVPKEAYDKLLAVMRRPTGGYPPVIACHLLPFFDAIEKATRERPKADAKVETPANGSGTVAPS